MSTVTTFIKHCRGGPNQSNKVRKWNRCIRTGQKEIKLLLFSDDMNVNLENLKESMKCWH